MPAEHARRFAQELKKLGLDARPSAEKVIVKVPGDSFGDFRTTHGKVTQALGVFRRAPGVGHEIVAKGVLNIVFKKARK